MTEMKWIFAIAISSSLAIGATKAEACAEGDAVVVGCTIFGTIIGEGATPVGAVVVGAATAYLADGIHDNYHRIVDPAPVPDLAPIPDMELQLSFGNSEGMSGAADVGFSSRSGGGGCGNGTFLSRIQSINTQQEMC